MGLPTILFIVFLVLKLTGYIDWSWWWVTAPIWIELLVGIIMVIFVGAGVRKADRSINNRRF